MIKKFVYTFLLFSICIITLAQKTVTRNGEIFKVHKVEAGQTLYSISRIYGVAVGEIQIHNKNTNTLSVGQELYIPTGQKATATTPSSTKPTASRSNNNDKPSPKTHTVEAGETLYAIGRKYSVSVDQIMKWNGLDRNALNVGQKLLVSNPSTKVDSKLKASGGLTTGDEEVWHEVVAGETLYAIAQQYETTVTRIKDDNPEIDADGLQIGQMLQITVRPPNKQYEEHLTPPKPVTVPESPYHGYERVTESGMVKLTTDSKYNSKFSYCLHKTAEQGTIIEIRNTSTGKRMWARVMGNLPATDSAILKVNSTVFQGLGGSGSSLRAEIEYIP